MNINKFIKEAHNNAVEKGFYDCVECGGDCTGRLCVNCRLCGKDLCNKYTSCPSCNGTGIDQNKNIPELLMLVITEIGEAVEALRENKFTRIDDMVFERLYECEGKFNPIVFKNNIHNTFEDELADVFIRLFDFAGYIGIEFKTIRRTDKITNNKCEDLIGIVDDILQLNKNRHNVKQLEIYFEYAICQLIEFCNYYKIDIEKHITAKMQYNKTRPKKHGKEF